MKKALGIVLLVFTLSLVSVPVFAEKVELNLKYWYAGVGGADQLVAEYEKSDEGYHVTALPLQIGDSETLELKPGLGGSLILSGEYSIYPSLSVGVSYWGLSRVSEVGVEFINDYTADYLIFLPGMSPLCLYGFEEWEVGWEKALLGGEGSLSMSALDICATKTLSGRGWEVGLSGGIRRATFDQISLTTLKIYLWEDEYEDEFEYRYESELIGFDINSVLSMSAIGPQIGIEGKYALADRVELKAGAKAGLLFGTAAANAAFTTEHVEYEKYYEKDSDDTGPDEFEYHEGITLSDSATESVQINTYDLSASLGYRITEQWSVEAGYYASIWKGVPALLAPDEYWTMGPAIDDGIDEPAPTRDIVVHGLTLGVNYKF